MICSERITELVECARRRMEPGQELSTHLALCAPCRERWDAERELTAQLRIIRTRTATLRSGYNQRESLLEDFSRIHRRTPIQSWAWVLSAAAALLLAVFLGHMWGLAAGKRTREIRPENTVLYEASNVLSKDASALSSDDFIAVPYTPPLAPGEIVRVVHADLNPEALASMGVDVDPSWAGELPADVVVGEDGLPRAVRITENSQF